MAVYNNPLMINNNFFCHKNLRKRIERHASESCHTMSDSYRELIAIALALEGINLSKKKREEIEDRADAIVQGSAA